MIKTVTIKLKGKKELIYSGITDIAPSRYRLKLYEGTEVVADLDKNDISSWYTESPSN